MAINISLDEERALVLHAFIARINEEEPLAFHDQSEQRVLWDLECLLEKELLQLNDSDYHEILKNARDCLRDK